MIKKQQKWIALFVALTFMWLLQVSSMPLAAAGSGEQVNAASAEQGPDYVEAIGQKAAPAKSKSILPYVLIGVGLVAVTAVLFLVVLKTKYDIVGTWRFTFSDSSNPSLTETFSLTFTGTKKSGTYAFTEIPIYTGTYAVDGKNVNMVVTILPYVTFSGQFTGKDTMSGTWTLNSQPVSLKMPLSGSAASSSAILNWTATRL